MRKHSIQLLCAILMGSLFLEPGCSKEAGNEEVRGGPPADAVAASPQVDIETLLVQLESPSAEMRVFAARKLASLKEAAAPAIPRLLDLFLDNREVQVQYQVESGTTVVEKTTPRDEASRTLVAIGPPAIQPLATAASKADARLKKLLIAEGLAPDATGLQKWLVKDIGEIGGPAVETLLSILADAEGYHEYVRQQAAESLGSIRAPESVLPLIEALDDASDGVRGSAAIALGMLGDPRGVEPLFQVVIKKRGPYLPGGWTTERVSEALEAITGKSWADFDYDYLKWRSWWRASQK